MVALTKHHVFRMVQILLLAAFLLPVSHPAPADPIRAAYANAGLLCGSEHGKHADHETHCVFCLLPGIDAPADHDCARITPEKTTRGVFSLQSLYSGTYIQTRHARAPPSFIL